MTRLLTALAVALALGLSMSGASANSDENNGGSRGWNDPSLPIQATLPAKATPHKAQ